MAACIRGGASFGLLTAFTALRLAVACNNMRAFARSIHDPRTPNATQ
jgi:hypothetical protein